MSSEPSAHVSDQQLERMACNELAAVELAAVEAHLEVCGECREIWQVVSAVRSAAADFDPGAIAAPEIRPPKGQLRSWMPWVGAAAVLTLILIPAQRFFEMQPTGSDPQLPVRSVTIARPIPLQPAEGARILEPIFSWRPVEDAVGYHVEVLDSLGEVVWVSDQVAGSNTAWHDGVEPAPGSYYWRVAAHFEDGVETIASELLSFELGSQKNDSGSK